MLAVLLGASQAPAACSPAAEATGLASHQGSWVATAYGPPWGGIQGNGITATGLDLTAGPPAYEVAVDPSVIPLRSYVHVQPNPFDTTSAFYAGDTGGAITGKHIDIYDWHGRASQNAWGERGVTVTPAPNPGAGNLLGAVPAPPPSEAASATGCQAALTEGSIGLTPGQTARILPDGSAAAPAEAPARREARDRRRQPHPHAPLPRTRCPLRHASPSSGPPTTAPAPPPSSSTAPASWAPTPSTPTSLESYGLPGPGRWITIYANSAHAWIVIAGIALDTANYGGPPIPAGSGPRWRTEPLANLADGTQYIARHPPGL